MRVEDGGSRGRVDMAALFNRNVYLFEFKVVEAEAEGAAMAQLKAEGCADKYRCPGRPVHLLGIRSGKKTRNIVAVDAECAERRFGRAMPVPSSRNMPRSHSVRCADVRLH